MTDILALAQSRRQTLAEELRRIEAFLATADDLMRGSPAETDQTAREQVVCAAPVEKTAPDPEIAVVAQPERPRSAPENKIPTDALFQKILADQRAQRAAMENDTLHFDRAPAAAVGG